MTIAELGSLGEFIGAIAVVISLIYIALQVKQNSKQLEENTKALHIKEEREAINSFSRARHLMTPHIETFAPNMGVSNFESLPPKERLIINMVIEEILWGHCILFRAYQAGISSADQENRCLQTLARNWSPVVQSWWESEKTGFTPDFANTVDTVISGGSLTTSEAKS